LRARRRQRNERDRGNGYSEGMVHPCS
jgi:hypothetical protein